MLDLKMHGMDGFEVLRWIRQQDQLRGLKVVILSASDDMGDVIEAVSVGGELVFD